MQKENRQHHASSSFFIWFSGSPGFQSKAFHFLLFFFMSFEEQFQVQV
jgi:hypothetical protein